MITRCYSTGDCAGAVTKEFSQLFVSSMANINHCCFDGDSHNPRSNLQMLSFTLNGGGCRSCNGKAMYVCTTTTIGL